jgi:hypothetical protein
MRVIVPRYSSEPAIMAGFTELQAVTIEARADDNGLVETEVGSGLLTVAGRVGANWVAGTMTTSPCVVVPAVVPTLQTTRLSALNC